MRAACYTDGMITDIHTHSAFSADGETPLAAMLERAAALGAAYYGVSEHFDYDYLADGVLCEGKQVHMIDARAYFRTARALQARYTGSMRVLVGGEFGYTPNPAAQAMYRDTIAAYAPDFVVNSVHTVCGADPWFQEYFVGREKADAYCAYLARVEESLSAPYAYDIVGHIGYVARNAPYPDPVLRYSDFPDALDAILRGVIARDKILEVNTSARRAGEFLPGRDILERYFALGGRLVSYASDAHSAARICDRRAETVAALRAVGFTYIAVPDCGKRYFIEI